MEKGVTIARKAPSQDAQDYHFLLQAAMDTLQRLTGKLWTDYNIHDPGITLLEILSYATTELGYCLNFPVQDLLASPAKAKTPESTFFAPDKILHSAPITASDYTRLFLDIHEVGMARMVPARKAPDFKGLYDLEVQLAEGADPVATRQKILDLYHRNQLELPAGKDENRMLKSNRNLCEDLSEVRFLSPTPIRFGISLEVQEGGDIDNLVGLVINALAEYLSPPVRFYRYQQLLKEGMYTEDILNGPRLAYGFIPDHALENLGLTEEIRTSELMQLLAKLPGIKEIRHIELTDRFNTQHAWVCRVENGKVPYLDPIGSHMEIYNRSGARIFSGNLEQKKEAMQDLTQLRTTQKAEEFQVPLGRFYNREIPRSLQNEFPRIYGVGETGLPARAGKERKGQARQLQGFLLFFEQTIANFFSQIAHLNKLFSIDPIDQTRYYQGLLEIPGAHYLYQPFINQYIQRNIDLEDERRLQSEWHVFKTGFMAWKQFQKENGAPCSDPVAVDAVWQAFAQARVTPLYLEAIRELDQALYAAVETRQGFLQRRNEVLDHLLARFAVDAMDYNFSRYRRDTPLLQIQGKSRLLQNFPYLSLARSSGMDLGAGNLSATSLETNAGEQLAPETNLAGLEELLQMVFNIPQRPLNHLANQVATDFLVGNQRPPQKPGESFLNIQLFDTQTDQAVQQLFKWGLDPKNYQFTQGKFQLQAPNGKILARFDPPEREKGRLLEVTKEKLIHQLHQAGEAFECLYVVEHLMLRPLGSSPSFGFAIHSPRDGRLLFESQKFRPWEDREAVLLDVLDKGRKQENYKVSQLGYRQYKVGLEGEAYELLGPLFIETEAETRVAIQEYVLDFNQLFVENIQGNSEAEKLFRMQSPGQLMAEAGSPQNLVNLFDAGFERSNYAEWEEAGDMYVRIVHPETKAVFQSFQRIVGESREEIRTLARYLMNYSREYLHQYYLEKIYRHPQLKFRTARHELFDGLTDPYSHTLTVVLPDWPPRFQDDLFQSNFQKVVFGEAPAHLAVNLRWLSYSRLKEFEDLYRKFLLARKEWQKQAFRRDAPLQQSDGDSPQASNRALNRAVAELEKEVSRLGDQLLELIASNG
jgi:hypothetical protein